MKKIAIVCIGLSMLVGGVLSGINIQRYLIVEEEQEEINDAIAIVNLDESYQKDDGSVINYATQLLPTAKTADMVETGLMNAKEGVKNGSFAAYIVLPSTFSQSIASINNSPQSSTLTYTMNDELSKEQTENVIYTVYNFEEALKNQTSYLYLTNILQEFQEGQDNASAVLSRETQSVNVVKSLNDNIAKIEDVITVKPESDQELVEYDIKLEETELEKIHERLVTKNEDIKLEIDTYVKDVASLIEKVKNGQPITDVAPIDDTVYDNTISGLTKSITTLMEDMKTSQQALWDSLSANGQQVWIMNQDCDITTFNDKGTSGTPSTPITLDEPVTTGVDDKTVANPDDVGLDTDIGMSVDPNPCKVVGELKLNDTPITYQGSTLQTWYMRDEAALADLSAKEIAKLDTNTKTLLTTINNAQTSLYNQDTTGLKSKVGAWSTDASKNLGSQNKYQSELSIKLKETNEMNKEKVDTVLQVNDEYATSLEKEVNDMRTNANENIDSAVEGVKGTLDDNLKLNTTTLQSFTYKIPNSRIGNSQNKAFKDQVVKPVSTTRELGSVKQSSNGTSIDPLLLANAVAVVFLLGSIGVYVVYHKKEKENE